MDKLVCGAIHKLIIVYVQVRKHLILCRITGGLMQRLKLLSSSPIQALVILTLKLLQLQSSA